MILSDGVEEVMVTCEEPGLIFLVDTRNDKDGYRAWLTRVGVDDAAVSGKLRWKDRRMGKEVPRSQQFHFFDAAKKAEVDKLYEERSVLVVPRAGARNCISCRFVCRWKPKAGVSGQSELVASSDANQNFKATARLSGHGFKDAHWWVERTSPTSRPQNRRCCLQYSVNENWPVMLVDAVRAFLQTKFLSREVHMDAPPEAGLAAGFCWKLLVPLYGIDDACREWHEDLVVVMVDLGGEHVPGDRCTWLFFEVIGPGRRLIGWIVLHVDDFQMSSRGDWLLAALKTKIRVGEEERDCFTWAGIGLQTTRAADGRIEEIRETQSTYCEGLEEVEVAVTRRSVPLAKATPEELGVFRGGLGGVGWLRHTRVELPHELSVLASRVNELTVADLGMLNKSIRKAKATPELGLSFRPLAKPWRVCSFGDASHDPACVRIYGGTMVFLAPPLGDVKDVEIYEKATIPCSLVDVLARKMERKAGNTLAAETHAGVNAYDRGRGIAILVDFLHGFSPYPKLEAFTW